jgi:hypothetical protein
MLFDAKGPEVRASKTNLDAVLHAAAWVCGEYAE